MLSHDPALAAPMPLASARSAPILPLALTSFVGREDELVQIDQAVTRNRLVTLVGPGGVGKTRLVLELARRRSPASEVWFVELAPVADPIAVPEAVASTLGANDHSPTEDPTSARSPVLRSVDRVGDRAATIILDNCEHVADATADLVETLLATCPGLTVVATSREPLRIGGEIQIPVAPLCESDAAQLFTERARGGPALLRGRRGGRRHRPAVPPARSPSIGHRARGRSGQVAAHPGDHLPPR